MMKSEIRRLSLSTSYVLHRIVPVCLALGGIAFSSPVQAQDVSPSDDWNDAVVIVGARVFDGTSTTDDEAVVVRGGLIESVGPSDHVPASVPRIDGTGATLLPGLIDAHTHTREVAQLERALRFGVTTVLDMFTRPRVDSMLRRVSAERNDVAGILSSGVLATAPGGHGTQSGAEIPTVAGPQDAAPFVEQQVRNGADYLKIVLNGQRAMGGMPTLDEATVRALVAAGKSHDLLVVAHVETHDDARTAVEAGVDGLAHVWRVPGAPEDLVNMIREDGVFVIPTLSIPGNSDVDFRMSFLEDPAVQPLLDSEAVENYTPVPMDELPAAQRAQAEALMRQLGLDDFSDFLQYHVESVATLHEAGVTILAGSDPPTAGVVHGIGLLQELELLVRAGLSPAEALSAATAQTADAFGLDDRGRIEAGRRADLVLVEGDPTEDVTALRSILRVWRGGDALDRSLSPLERGEALGLDTARVGRVTAYFDPANRERAVELATLSEEAASFFDRELAISFYFGVAALAPEHWVSEFPDIPYAIPWASVPERLLFVPSSLEEGLLVRGRSTMTERRRVVDFVTLHEYGHLATKEYFYPASERDYLPVSWFNELLPNVFAYAFVASTDPEWAMAGKEMWRGVIESREPPVVSLDWGFMNDLPPDELARTYAWYQNLLNLRAAELYEEHGLDFLRMVKKELAWEEAGGWTTESLLATLDGVAPGFEAWARDLQNGDYLPRDDD